MKYIFIYLIVGALLFSSYGYANPERLAMVQEKATVELGQQKYEQAPAYLQAALDKLALLIEAQKQEMHADGRGIRRSLVQRAQHMLRQIELVRILFAQVQLEKAQTKLQQEIEAEKAEIASLQIEVAALRDAVGVSADKESAADGAVLEAEDAN